MSDTKWVCHKSGQGEKWEIMCENTYQYGAKHEMKDRIGAHWLPKSEYVTCDPPEQWKDVTGEYDAFNDQQFYTPNHRGVGLLQGDRLRKITLASFVAGETVRHEYAFVIERKVQK